MQIRRRKPTAESATGELATTPGNSRRRFRGENGVAMIKILVGITAACAAVAPVAAEELDEFITGLKASHVRALTHDCSDGFLHRPDGKGGMIRLILPTVDKTAAHYTADTDPNLMANEDLGSPTAANVSDDQLAAGITDEGEQSDLTPDQVDMLIEGAIVSKDSALGQMTAESATTALCIAHVTIRGELMETAFVSETGEINMELMGRHPEEHRLLDPTLVSAIPSTTTTTSLVG
jgi:hypothetical protein